MDAFEKIKILFEDVERETGLLEYVKIQLKQVSEIFEISRASFWVLKSSDNTLNCDLLYVVKSNSFKNEMMVFSSTRFHTFFSDLEKNKYLKSDKVLQDSKVSELLNSYLLPNRIAAFIALPIKIGGRLVGMLMLEQENKFRKWSDVDILAATAVVKNISEKILQEKSKSDSEKLEQSVKLQRLGELTNFLIHEVNNSNMIVLGNINFALKKQFVDVKSYENVLDKIQKQVARTSDLINKVKNSGEIAGAVKQKINLSNCLKDVILAFADYASEMNVKLINETLDEVVVEANEQEITQLLFNLIKNSCMAIQDKPIEARWVRLWAEYQGDLANIYVQDAGNGIPEDIAKNLFVKNFTTKKNIGGSGLGLNISREIAKKHGGSVEYLAHSINTTFKVSISIKSTKENSK